MAVDITEALDELLWQLDKEAHDAKTISKYLDTQGDRQASRKHLAQAEARFQVIKIVEKERKLFP